MVAAPVCTWTPEPTYPTRTPSHTPTGTLSPTPADCITPAPCTGSGCPDSQSQFPQCGYTLTPFPTSIFPPHTATPTATPTATYAIRFSNELGINSATWTPDEQTAIEAAVANVGEAFAIQLNIASSQIAFHRVMTDGADPQYVYFFKADGTSNAVTIIYPPALNKPNFTETVTIGGCLTVNNNGLPRTVVCNWSASNRALYPEHAIVHELGHVFTNRSSLATSSHQAERESGLLFAAIQGTFSGTCSPSFAPPQSTSTSDPFGEMEFPLSNCSQIHDNRLEFGTVMGRIGNPLEWARGERGWGSGPDNAFTPFQQHPLELFPSDSNTTKVDETAADMFLNWVYRRQTDTPPTYKMSVPGEWEGFKNMKWLNNEVGSDDNTYPGDARFEWMNRVMNQIFSLKGW